MTFAITFVMQSNKSIKLKLHSSVQRIRHYMDWSVNSIQYLAMKEVHSTFLECFLKTAANFNKQDDGECPRTDRMLFQPVGIFSWEKKSVFPDSRPAVGIVSFSPRLPLRSKTRMHLQRHGQYIRYISWKNSRITLFSPSSFFCRFCFWSDATTPAKYLGIYDTQLCFPPTLYLNNQINPLFFCLRHKSTNHHRSFPKSSPPQPPQPRLLTILFSTS